MDILFKNYTENVYEELDSLFSYDQWKERTIFLFGLNIPAEIEVEYFDTRNIRIAGIIDNSLEKQGEYYRGYNIISPTQMCEKYGRDIFVIIASSYSNIMKHQLLELGCKEENIYILKSFDVNNNVTFKRNDNLEYYEMTLRDIQMESVEILKYVDDFCRKKNIRYYLAYGSLIGAIRHKGCIPWDDDIDLLMPYCDYIRFCREFPSNDEYYLYSQNSMSDMDICNITIAQVMSCKTVSEVINFPLHIKRHVCIDIFPMNGYPNQNEERIKYEKELKNFDLIWRREILSKIGTSKFSYDKKNKIWRLCEEIMTRYEFDNCKYVGSVAIAPFNHSIAPIEMYEKAIDVEFENEMIKAPRNSDYILRSTYGNYMELPSEEERNKKHFFKTYMIKEA